MVNSMYPPDGNTDHRIQSSPTRATPPRPPWSVFWDPAGPKLVIETEVTQLCSCWERKHESDRNSLHEQRFMSVRLKNGSSSANSAQKQSFLPDQGGFIGKFGISSFQQVYYKIEFKLVTKFRLSDLSAVKPPLKQMEGCLKKKVKPKCPMPSDCYLCYWSAGRLPSHWFSVLSEVQLQANAKLAVSSLKCFFFL